MVSAVSRRADRFGGEKELCWWVALVGTVLGKRFLSSQLGQHQWHWAPVHPPVLPWPLGTGKHHGGWGLLRNQKAPSSRGGVVQPLKAPAAPDQHLLLNHPVVVDSEIVRGTFKMLLKCTFHNS